VRELCVGKDVAGDRVGEVGEVEEAAGGGVEEVQGGSLEGEGWEGGGTKNGRRRGREDARRRTAEAPVSRISEEGREARKECCGKVGGPTKRVCSF
jgi:hypothetical protein